MKKLNEIIILISLGALLGACSENFDEFNQDEKNPTNVPGESLFTNAQIELVDQISSTNVNNNVWKLYAQYWNETTYTDETNYDVQTRTIPQNAFMIYYRDILKDFEEAKQLIEQEEPILEAEKVRNHNQLQIIELMKVYTFQRLVDIFGNVPYDAALSIDNVTPEYTDAFTIYQDLIERADAAVNALDPSYGSFGEADLINGGSIERWRLFGQTLKLKLGITIADHNRQLARNTVESAVNAGVISDASGNFTMQYQTSTPYTNPLHEDLVLSGRNDFVPANTIVDTMRYLNDPRMDYYFDVKRDTSDDGIDNPIYLGGQYGTESAYSDHSHIDAQLHQPSFPGILFTYSEIQFYLAEAAEREFSVGGNAEEFYNNGILASVQFWGGTEQQAQDYLDNPDVAYQTAPGTWREKIGIQAWIAAYSRGLLGFTSWRKLDAPRLNMPPEIDEYSEIPKRFTYPTNEQRLNAENYRNASEAIGGDKLTTRLFWDKEDV